MSDVSSAIVFLYPCSTCGGSTVVFNQYDTDKSGSIDEKEFRELANAVHSACPMFSGNFAKAMHECDT